MWTMLGFRIKKNGNHHKILKNTSNIILNILKIIKFTSSNNSITKFSVNILFLQLFFKKISTKK